MIRFGPSDGHLGFMLAKLTLPFANVTIAPRNVCRIYVPSVVPVS